MPKWSFYLSSSGKAIEKSRYISSTWDTFPQSTQVRLFLTVQLHIQHQKMLSYSGMELHFKGILQTDKKTQRCKQTWSCMLLDICYQVQGNQLGSQTASLARMILPPECGLLSCRRTHVHPESTHKLDQKESSENLHRFLPSCTKFSS